MSKFHEFPIDEYQSEWIFRPLRNKKDVLILLMRTIKVMLLGKSLPPPRHEVGKIVLFVSKMSRIFFVSEKKIFSIALPFVVDDAGESLVFKDSLHPLIDNKLTSDIISILENDVVLTTPDVYSFFDQICPLIDYDANLWQFFRKLLTSEDGYIRYDFDDVHEDGHKHPLHHLDVFYESHASFKLGLGGSIDRAIFQEILDITTDCYYAVPA